MAETVQQLLRERAEDDNPGVRYGDRTWSWREHVAEASAVASTLIGLADPSRPLHVGTLLGNTPDMLRAMAAGALGASAPGEPPRELGHARQCRAPRG
jgi:fatty-acyl-CoA synthase